MKKLFFILVFIFTVQNINAQELEYGNKNDTIELCTYMQGTNFSTDIEAERGLEKILSVIGASKRFILQPCDNIKNAVATSYKGIRYIFYDREFMNSISNGENWGNLFILAHEVGHHINGHSLDLVLYATKSVEPKSLSNRRQQELEADEFAGFILSKLGGSFNSINKVLRSISSNKDDSYSTHPSLDKRLAAAKKGFEISNSSSEPQIYTEKSSTNEDYFYKAYQQTLEKDFYGAISSYSVYLTLNPESLKAYVNRGNVKSRLNDYYGAISDYNQALNIEPNNYIALAQRGVAKFNLNDFNGAESDYTSSIYSKPNDISFYNRGVLKYNDDRFKEALSDLNKAIELNPKYYQAYAARGATKLFFENSDACGDILIAKRNGIEIHPQLLKDACGENYIEGLIGRITIPEKIKKVSKYQFILNYYVTPDEKFLVIRWSSKLCLYSIHHFKTLKLIGISNANNRGYELYYKQPEFGKLEVSKSNFMHYDYDKKISYLLTTTQNNRTWDIEFKVDKSKVIPDGFIKLKEELGYMNEVGEGIFKSKTFGDISVILDKPFPKEITFIKPN